MPGFVRSLHKIKMEMKEQLDDFKAFGRVACEVAEHISPEGRRGRVSAAGVYWARSISCKVSVVGTPISWAQPI